MTVTVNKYLAKVTSQYNTKPKFMAELAMVLQPFVDLQNNLAHMPIDFCLDYAVGPQLDAVGERINLSRNIVAPIRDPYFRWGDPTRGWGFGRWWQDIGYGNYITQLDDNTYRQLLYARILANKWDGTTESAIEIMNGFFNQFYPNSYVIGDDKMCLTLIYGMAGVIPDDIMLEIFSNGYLPLHPAGVRTYYLVTSVQNTSLFGWGVQNQYISGWGVGAWGMNAQDFITNPPNSVPAVKTAPSYITGA